MNCCEDCLYYNFDDESEGFVCEMDLDEDEMVRFLTAAVNACPFYRRGDDYSLARKQ